MCKNTASNTATTEPKEKLKRSYTRSLKMTYARLKNKKYAMQIDDFLKEVVIDDETVVKYLEKFNRNIKGCSYHSLYRKQIDGRKCCLISSHTCDHRTCTICNMIRAKKIRRKFMSFLTSDIRDIPLKGKERHFFDENFEHASHVSGLDIVNNLDFMHLTLTVPHTAKGWNGKKFYAKELLQLFNKMRKCDWYKDNVFGGTQTVEVEKKSNGLHIHIHSMIAVKKVQGSRNYLAQQILQKWNALTIDFTRQNEGFSTQRIDGLRDGFVFLSPVEFGEMCNQLDSRGSTFIGLKSLYYPTTFKDFSQARRVDRFMQNGKPYVYATSGNPESMLRGAMECLKYHFEPCVLEDETGNLDIDLLCQLIPNIYRQRLYARSGAFTRVQQLKLAEVKATDGSDEADEVAETAQDEAFDPGNGQPADRNEYEYVITDPRHIVFNDNKIHYSVPAFHTIFTIPTESSTSLKDAVIAFGFYAREYSLEQRRMNEVEDLIGNYDSEMVLLESRFDASDDSAFFIES